MEKRNYPEKFGRLIKDDEICIEFDAPCPDYELAIYDTFLNLQNAGYNLEVWKAEGMKSAHLHIKNIQGLEKLPYKVQKKYKRMVIEKYVDEQFLPYVDFSLCGKHRIATENENHFKYGTPKLLQVGRKVFENKLEEHLIKRAEIELKKEASQKQHYDSNNPGESITRIAIDNGVLVGKNGMCLCPFHNDTIPSLSLDEERGIWHCFGCGKGGNVAKFKEELARVK